MEGDKIHPSWKELKPLIVNSNRISQNNESEEEYCTRMQENGWNIPVPVLEQWLYEHYFSSHTIRNYAWINYYKSKFCVTCLDASQIVNLHVIKEFELFFDEDVPLLTCDDFACNDGDREHWKNYGTWRVPPVIIDSESFENIPDHAEIRYPLQIIEGHSRLRYFRALYSAKNLEKHKVFLLTNS